MVSAALLPLSARAVGNRWVAACRMLLHDQQSSYREMKCASPHRHSPPWHICCAVGLGAMHRLPRRLQAEPVEGPVVNSEKGDVTPPEVLARLFHDFEVSEAPPS